MAPDCATILLTVWYVQYFLQLLTHGITDDDEGRQEVQDQQHLRGIAQTIPGQGLQYVGRHIVAKSEITESSDGQVQTRDA